MICAHTLEDGDQDLERRVPGACSHTRGAGVDAYGARLDRCDGVGDAHRHVVVPVESDLGLWAKTCS